MRCEKGPMRSPAGLFAGGWGDGTKSLSRPNGPTTVFALSGVGGEGAVGCPAWPTALVGAFGVCPECLGIYGDNGII